MNVVLEVLQSIAAVLALGIALGTSFKATRTEQGLRMTQAAVRGLGGGRPPSGFRGRRA